MRTIKFRGKTTKETTCHHRNEWSYGDLSVVDERILIDNGMYYAEVKEETVGQFTGLFDKNGKEIYEGDIVKFTKWNGELTTGLVKWDDCNPCMCIEYKTEYKQTDWEYDFLKCGSMIIEVVGNIYDNPELLKD